MRNAIVELTSAYLCIVFQSVTDEVVIAEIEGVDMSNAINSTCCVSVFSDEGVSAVTDSDPSYKLTWFTPCKSPALASS